MRAVRDPIGFFAYVAFFPQLVAGPIERARHLLPQFFVPRVMEPEAFASGLRQMLWGFFCKLVVADNCATVVNAIFNHNGALPGSVMLLGSVLFAFQIYADFSGYSHIALGTARLFGFELMQNFATPYFSQSHPEFWRRWHISLSSWFRDYVYIPLGGNRASKARQAFNLLVTFTLSGLWHGANWTFIVWGVLNGLYVIPRVFIGEPLARPATSRNPFVRVPTIALRILVTFALTVLAWIFFRSPTISGAWRVVGEIASPSLFSSPISILRSMGLLTTVAYAGLAISFLLAMEWWQRDKKYALELGERAALLTWPACALVFVITLFFRYTGASLDFIYFQF
jgi:D-alanyl-lipoteichoic acid acyltransferase DltB (MBOAT superfamily)